MLPKPSLCSQLADDNEIPCRNQDQASLRLSTPADLALISDHHVTSNDLLAKGWQSTGTLIFPEPYRVSASVD